MKLGSPPKIADLRIELVYFASVHAVHSGPPPRACVCVP